MDADGSETVPDRRPDPVRGQGKANAGGRKARPVSHPGIAAGPVQGSPALGNGKPGEQVENRVPTMDRCPDM